MFIASSRRAARPQGDSGGAKVTGSGELFLDRVNIVNFVTLRGLPGGAHGVIGGPKRIPARKARLR
jgi:hypothetical protein